METAAELVLVADWFDTHLAKMTEAVEDPHAVGLEVRVTGGTIRGAVDRINGALKHYLGIPYTAARTGEAHPVMVWIHGGGLIAGAGNLNGGPRVSLMDSRAGVPGPSYALDSGRGSR